MLDSMTDTDVFKGLASIVTGGAFVGWYRERRKGKQDAYSFAMEFMNQQAKELAAERLRVDALIIEMATLKALYESASQATTILKSEIAELKVENIRLKTALGEHGRNNA